MITNFNHIHNFFLTKSKDYPFVKNEIIKNGVISLKKTNLDIFTFLFKTIVSQQISDKAAKSIWDKICSKSPKKPISIKSFYSSKFLQNFLNEIKISKPKINYISKIYSSIIEGRISSIKLKNMNEDEIRSHLNPIKGIGPWTCDMLLIFFLNNQNIFPEKDLVINKMVIKLQNIEKKKIDFKKKFSPFLSIFSLHLWKMSKRIL